MKRIIFHPALPMSDKEWPFMCPTETLNSRLLESVKRALNLTEGFNVIVHEPQPRHDWVGGHWVQRSASRGPGDPLYANAAYEDVDVFDAEGNLKAILRCRRVTPMQNPQP
jgi:hypothetical protein